jgi:DNA-binding MarR family transcriptional regulator
MTVVSGIRTSLPEVEPQGPGSQQALRLRNLSALLSELEQNGPGTQRQLSLRTGLSQATVSNLVKILVTKQQVTTEPTISSGRRATLVRALGH